MRWSQYLGVPPHYTRGDWRSPPAVLEPKTQKGNRALGLTPSFLDNSYCTTALENRSPVKDTTGLVGGGEEISTSR